MMYNHELVGASDFLYVLYLGSCAKMLKLKRLIKNYPMYFLGAFPLISLSITLHLHI